MGLALGTFMEVLDTSIANVAVPTISGSLGVATSEGTWVISSYSVASAIAVPLTGWLARRVGEVKLFTISVVLFSIASALCGLAHNFESLIGFRLLQGLVSGPMVPLSQTILMRSYPPEKRGLALGLWAMTVIVAPIFGPVMGGYITDNFSWPWIFYINVPIGIFSAAIAFFLLRGHETKTTKQRIDAVGLALLVIGVSSLQMMLDLGKDRDWFGSSFIVTLAIVAAIALAFMFAWEMTEKEPVIDLSLFRDRNFAMGVLITSLGFLAFFGSVVVLPLWLQTVMGYTPGLAGLATAPVGILALVISPILGRNMHRLDLRVVASFAFLVFAFVSHWNSTFTLDTPFNQIVIPRLIQGIGVACFFVPMTTITLSSVPDDRLAGAAGLSNFLRTLIRRDRDGGQHDLLGKRHDPASRGADRIGERVLAEHERLYRAAVGPWHRRAGADCATGARRDGAGVHDVDQRLLPHLVLWVRRAGCAGVADEAEEGRRGGDGALNVLAAIKNGSAG